jgi:hypothetical protein
MSNLSFSWILQRSTQVKRAHAAPSVLQFAPEAKMSWVAGARTKHCHHPVRLQPHESLEPRYFVTTSSCMNTADSSSTLQTSHKARGPHPRRVKQDNCQFGRDRSNLNNPILSTPLDLCTAINCQACVPRRCPVHPGD